MSQTDFTIADVLAWARTKPADGLYTYNDPTNCALCQFLVATNRAEKPAVSPGFGWGERGAGMQNRQPYDLAIEPALKAETFGQLVARLEALCPDQVIPPSEWTRLDAYMTDIELASA